MSNPPTIDDFLPDDNELANIDVTTVNPAAAAPAEADATPAEPALAEATQETPGEAVEAAGEASEDDDAARAARLAHELRDARRRQRQQDRELTALKAGHTPAPDAEIDRLANERAHQIAAQREYAAKANTIFETGVKEFGRTEFAAMTQEIADSFGPESTATVVETISEFPNAAQVLAHLVNNPDKLDKLAALSPHKLGAALALESTKLAAPKPIPKSNAPKPIKPVVSGGSVSSGPPKDMDEWMAQEQAVFIKSLGYGA